MGTVSLAHFGNMYLSIRILSLSESKYSNEFNKGGTEMTSIILSHRRHSPFPVKKNSVCATFCSQSTRLAGVWRGVHNRAARLRGPLAVECGHASSTFARSPSCYTYYASLVLLVRKFQQGSEERIVCFISLFWVFYRQEQFFYCKDTIKIWQQVNEAFIKFRNQIIYLRFQFAMEKVYSNPVSIR